MGDFEVFNEMGDKVVSLGDFAVWAILQFGRFCSLGDFGVGDFGVGRFCHLTVLFLSHLLRE